MNLIICMTPFQLLMAERIIKLYSEEKFFLIVITTVMNNKYRYYFERVSGLCDKSCIIKINLTSNLNKLVKLFELKFFLRGSVFSKVFLSNINSIYIHTILSSINSDSNIYTFDDGTANLDIESSLYKSENIPLLHKLYRCMFRVKISGENIRQKSLLHYTIYKDESNIVEKDRCKPIELFTLFKPIPTSNKEVSILLGQNIYSNSYDNSLFIEDVIKTYNIDYYYPHPSENNIIENVKYLNSELVFEEFFVEKFKGDRVLLYTFFSSAALNLSYVYPDLNVVVIKPSVLGNKFDKCYDLFLKKGFNIVPYS